MNLRAVLEERFRRALSGAGMDDAPALVRPSAKPQFGDYQANGCMAAAKKAGMNPRDLAKKVVAAVELGDLVKDLKVEGPGFINITLNTDWLAAQLAARLDDPQLGVDAPADPQTVVVDYSSPNLAKEMHVGHLRRRPGPRAEIHRAQRHSPEPRRRLGHAVRHGDSWHVAHLHGQGTR